MRRRLAIVLLLVACGDDGATLDAGAPASDAEALADAPACVACTYGTPMPAGAIATGGANELSGLAVSRTDPDLVWAHNDSGDGPRLFGVTRAGASRGILTLPGAPATDWEDLATGPCGVPWCLYVADIGDNNLARASIRIYEVDEPAQIAGAVDATFRTFEVAYPDGAHNAEALFVDPRDGAAYVITKQATSPSRVFHMPRIPGVVSTATEIGSLTIPTGSLLVTAADLHADACGVRLLVRTYTNLFELRGGPDLAIAELLATAPAVVPVAIEPQGEAVAYLPDGRAYLTVSEANAPMLSRISCR